MRGIGAPGYKNIDPTDDSNSISLGFYLTLFPLSTPLFSNSISTLHKRTLFPPDPRCPALAENGCENCRNGRQTRRILAKSSQMLAATAKILAKDRQLPIKGADLATVNNSPSY